MTATNTGARREEGGTRRLARRGLLRGLAAGGASAALAVPGAGAARAESEADVAGAAGDHRKLGFRATDHMRWFYHRARW